MTTTATKARAPKILPKMMPIFRRHSALEHDEPLAELAEIQNILKWIAIILVKVQRIF